MIAALGFLVLSTLSAPALAEEQSNTPFIDEVRKELQEQDAKNPKKESSESYTEKLKKKLEKEDEEKRREEGEPEKKSYIDQLKEEDPSLKEKPKGGYIDQQKAHIPDKKEGGAIDAYNHGTDQLHAKQYGEITGAFGFKLGAASNRDITAGDLQARDFDDVYTGWAPEAQFYYEWQPWHSEFWGNIGVIGSVGVSYFNGFGKFKIPVPKGCVPPGPCSGDTFPEDSETRFFFWQVPVWAGLDYRFNLFKYVRPFIMAGPMAIVYFESREDDHPAIHGMSKAFYASAGAAILLDGLSDRASWDLYMEHGIHHYYLTLDYSKITTISSAVDFNESAFNVGVAFEF